MGHATKYLKTTPLPLIHNDLSRANLDFQRFLRIKIAQQEIEVTRDHISPTGEETYYRVDCKHNKKIEKEFEDHYFKLQKTGKNLWVGDLTEISAKAPTGIFGNSRFDKSDGYMHFDIGEPRLAKAIDAIIGSGHSGLPLLHNRVSRTDLAFQRFLRKNLDAGKVTIEKIEVNEGPDGTNRYFKLDLKGNDALAAEFKELFFALRHSRQEIGIKKDLVAALSTQTTTDTDALDTGAIEFHKEKGCLYFIATHDKLEKAIDALAGLDTGHNR